MVTSESQRFLLSCIVIGMGLLSLIYADGLNGFSWYGIVGAVIVMAGYVVFMTSLNNWGRERRDAREKHRQDLQALRQQARNASGYSYRDYRLIMTAAERLLKVTPSSVIAGLPALVPSSCYMDYPSPETCKLIYDWIADQVTLELSALD